MPEHTGRLDRMSEHMSDRMPEHLSDRMSEFMSENILVECQISLKLPEKMPDR
jgi:hypothetical protein